VKEALVLVQFISAGEQRTEVSDVLKITWELSLASLFITGVIRLLEVVDDVSIATSFLVASKPKQWQKPTLIQVQGIAC
jgi:hypothetical protein